MKFLTLHFKQKKIPSIMLRAKSYTVHQQRYPKRKKAEHNCYDYYVAHTVAEKVAKFLFRENST